MGMYTSENTNFFDWIFSFGGIFTIILMFVLAWLVLKAFDKAEDKYKKEPAEEEPKKQEPKYEDDLEKFFSDDIGDTTLPMPMNSGYNIEASQEMYIEPSSYTSKSPLSEQEEMEVIAKNMEQDEGMRVADEDKIMEKKGEQ